MKSKTQTNSDVGHDAKVVALSINPTDAAVFGFQRAQVRGEKRRTAKRPASQHPELRQPDPNPGMAAPGAAGGTAVNAETNDQDLRYPQFEAIASRRDQPLELAEPQPKNFQAKTAVPAQAETAPAKPAPSPRAESIHRALLRYSGIND